jgi:2-keto-4-pentenoate hydratase
MNNNLKNKIADKLVNAFLKNKIISPLPQKITKKNLLMQMNLENYVKVKLKNLLLGLKLVAQEFL